MSILLNKAGILTTVQDLGRVGYRRFGINPGGVMDRTAARLINILVGNDESEALLEMHFPAVEIVFETACAFAIGGADFAPELDGRAVVNWRVYSAPKGGVLRFTQKKAGNRGYLAVRGGFEIGKWLGSSSTNLTAGLGGLDGRKLRSGDRIGCLETALAVPIPGNIQSISPTLIPKYSSFPTIRVIAGAEFDRMDEPSQVSFEENTFAISDNSDRMGFRLTGEPLRLAEPLEIVSAAASFGTIQLLPDGHLIVLMADHQTSGGYPRIAHVIERDLPVIAQLGSRDKVCFHLVTLAEAEALNLESERDIARFRVGCRLRPVI